MSVHSSRLLSALPLRKRCCVFLLFLCPRNLYISVCTTIFPCNTVFNLKDNKRIFSISPSSYFLQTGLLRTEKDLLHWWQRLFAGGILLQLHSTRKLSLKFTMASPQAGGSGAVNNINQNNGDNDPPFRWKRGHNFASTLSQARRTLPKSGHFYERSRRYRGKRAGRPRKWLIW